MNNKKIPQRQCIACREHFPKRQLVRIVKSPEGEISIDFTGKKAGRGAYVCKSSECIMLAKKKRALQRAFETEVSDEVYDSLAKDLEVNSGKE